jgi:hypothetical protein
MKFGESHEWHSVSKTQAKEQAQTNNPIATKNIKKGLLAYGSLPGAYIKEFRIKRT